MYHMSTNMQRPLPNKLLNVVIWIILGKMMTGSFNIYLQINLGITSLVINEEQKWLERAAAEKCNAMHLLNSVSAK